MAGHPHIITNTDRIRKGVQALATSLPRRAGFPITDGAGSPVRAIPGDFSSPAETSEAGPTSASVPLAAASPLVSPSKRHMRLGFQKWRKMTATIKETTPAAISTRLLSTLFDQTN